MRSVQARAWAGRRSMPSAAIAATALLARLRPSSRRRERTALSMDSSGRRQGNGPCAAEERGSRRCEETAGRGAAVVRIVALDVPASSESRRREDEQTCGAWVSRFFIPAKISLLHLNSSQPGLQWKRPRRKKGEDFGPLVCALRHA